MFFIAILGVLSLSAESLALTIRQNNHEGQPLLVYKGSQGVPVYAERNRQAIRNDQLSYYNTRQAPAYEQAEDNTQEADDYYYRQQTVRQQPIQEQPQQQQQYSYQSPGLTTQKELDQIFKNLQTARLKVPKKPIVQQYLKEVTPTTKTAYNNIRPVAYPRFAAPQVKPEALEEPQRQPLKQPQVQYIVQADSQQQQSYAQQQFVQPQYEPREEPRQQPQHHQQKYRQQPTQLQQPETHLYNPLPIQKPAQIEQATPEESSSQSTIYVSQNFLKKPQRVFLKPAPQKPAANLRNIQSSRQEYQNFIQPNSYPHHEQTYQHEQLDLRYQGEAEVPQKDLEQQTVVSKDSLLLQNRQPVRFHIESKEVPNYPTENKETVRYQNVVPRRYQQPRLRDQPEVKEQVRYQIPLNARENPRYPLEDDQEYQNEDKLPTRYQTVQREAPNYPTPAPQQIRYHIAKQEQKYPEQQREVAYQQEEQPENNQEIRYHPNSDAIVRFRPAGNGAAVAYQQTLENSNIRYYRKLSRPTSYQQRE